MAKTDTISVRVLPGRALTHDGKRLEAGKVFDLPEAQAQALLAAGHIERVEVDAQASGVVPSGSGHEPTKDPQK
ncbi:hypothetical protein HW511_00255 [Asaia siamensis]|uniref:DUF7210 domain-containing protein n=1 Tax=Asaia siamensis TaxID=110479 RepID=A0ABQ1M3N9_9PROT|nr:hypothetical protein [Asaia siamensis]GBR06407.1 hypothetical protein AA0323_1383 [Asaia siamensis NRIC 0323]GGC34201.1 hypothetical protein GCM10007207_19680 [Asaia siamensis]